MNSYKTKGVEMVDVEVCIGFIIILLVIYFIISLIIGGDLRSSLITALFVLFILCIFARLYKFK